MTSVAIIDSGGANIASLMYAFDRLHVSTELTADPDKIRNAEKVLLPGVGAAKDAMERLRDAELIDVIRGLRQPVLGICLGMQLLGDASEEDDVECLGIIPGTARKFAVADNFAVPNMGWCETSLTKTHGVLDGLEDGEYFYYLHSYALPVSDHTIATARHSDEFSAIVAKDNFIAAQFHPERSSTSGARLLRNFLGFSV